MTFHHHNGEYVVEERCYLMVEGGVGKWINEEEEDEKEEEEEEEE